MRATKLKKKLLILKKVNVEKKNDKKKHSWKNVFYLSKLSCFFSEMFFLSPEIDCFFSEICNNQMRAPGRKKHMLFLVMRGLNLMRALIWNREKKT